jgi:phosphoglycerol transferase MdoB-like AlkP superfamily enzyme
MYNPLLRKQTVGEGRARRRLPASSLMLLPLLLLATRKRMCFVVCLFFVLFSAAVFVLLLLFSSGRSLTTRPSVRPSISSVTGSFRFVLFDGSVYHRTEADLGTVDLFFFFKNREDGRPAG